MKPRRVLLLCAVLTLAVLPAAAQTKPAPVPPFTAAKELKEYLSKNGPDQRIKLYQSYFSSADMNAEATALIAPLFDADLPTMAAAVRKDLADRAIKAVRTPPTGTRKTASAPQGEAYRADLRGFPRFLGALAGRDDTAVPYYLSLPLRNAEDGTLPMVELDAARSAVLKRIAPSLQGRLGAEGRLLLLRELARWPWRIGNAEYDVRTLRDCAPLFQNASLDLFTAVRAADGALDSLDWKAFAASKPTDDEAAYVYAGFLDFRGESLTGERITDLALRKGKGWDAAGKAVLALRESPSVRARAVANLLAYLSSGKPADATGLASPIASCAATADDWSAFAAYRIAAARGEKLSDESLLACLDPRRPSLAAAVIEDRWAAEYLDQAKMTAYVDPAQAASSAFEAAVLKALPALAKAPLDRHFVPAMMATIHLGRSRYVDQVIFLMDSPYPAVRETMARTLLRFADARFYAYFMRRLFDEDQTVRHLCIQGLGAIRDSRAVEPLAGILNDPGEREWIRAACARALGDIGDRRCIQIFTSFLMAPRGKDGGDLSLRLYAAQYLGQKKERTAVDALIANLDPAAENQLNYACLEALGKINDPAGHARLLPILAKAWKVWSAPPSEDGDNFYAALWALFPYRAEPLIQLASDAFDALKGRYSDGAFAAAYYLVRNAKEPKEEWKAWYLANRGRFFGNSWRVYEYAVMMEGAWDAETLLFLAQGMDGLNDNTKSWLLSGMTKKPSLAFLPLLAKLRDSESSSVRGWTAHLADDLTRILPRPQTEDGLKLAAELAVVLEGWRKDEKESYVVTWLGAARRDLESYRKANP